MKHSRIIKRGLAMLVASMCLASSMAIAFATNENPVGWPSGDTNTVGVGSAPVDGSVISATDDKQDVIQYKTWGNTDISATINEETTADSEGDLLSKDIYAKYSDTLPDVSIDDLIDWSNRKGFEIIKFLQTFIQPFAIIIFMIAAIMVLIGSIGNSQLATKGMMGLVMSVITYSCCIYAPSILSVLVAWLGA